MSISNLWKLIQSEICCEINTRDMADDLGYIKDETFRRYYIGSSYPSIQMCLKITSFYGGDEYCLYKKIQEQKREDMVKNNDSLSKLPSDKHDI